MDEKYISIKELCEMFKVSRATVDRWRKNGLPFLKIGSSIRFVEFEAIKWVKESSSLVANK